MLDIIIFNVELGQCIFFYPRPDKKEFGLMVDCGNTPNFEPIDKLIEWNLLPKKSDERNLKYLLKSLTLTNYDQDHFSGLPYLQKKVEIETTRFPKNISSTDLRKIKDEITEPIEAVIKIIDNAGKGITLDTPYEKRCFHLEQDDFPDEDIDTNKLSQIVFVTFKDVRICIPGDLTSDAWEKILKKANVIDYLKGTKIFIASHHGREDGFNENVFKYCKPEVIILSDKDIIHKTQEGQTQTYAGMVQGNGIILNGKTGQPRKVLTTRSDKHIWIRIEDNGARTYKTITE
ncbi:MAG TPA: hypothetical protein PK664_02460 [Paludibacteraceae bacterium]|nr:hypothetical protein [Paludibacteraceae bacterium]HPS10211.1 hypothetical protein [Paludibacteraceae bacterium]